jgi:hypothetical protein
MFELEAGLVHNTTMARNTSAHKNKIKNEISAHRNFLLLPIPPPFALSLQEATRSNSQKAKNRDDPAVNNHLLLDLKASQLSVSELVHSSHLRFIDINYKIRYTGLERVV